MISLIRDIRIFPNQISVLSVPRVVFQPPSCWLCDLILWLSEGFSGAVSTPSGGHRPPPHLSPFTAKNMIASRMMMASSDFNDNIHTLLGFSFSLSSNRDAVGGNRVWVGSVISPLHLMTLMSVIHAHCHPFPSDLTVGSSDPPPSKI